MNIITVFRINIPLSCTHAATFVMLCRVLAGKPVDDPTETDFIPRTTEIAMFGRGDSNEVLLADPQGDISAPQSDIEK